MNKVVIKIATYEIMADPDSSLNPAYIAVIPEFHSLVILPIFLMATILAAILVKKSGQVLIVSRQYK